jgi:ERF superfamily
MNTKTTKAEKQDQAVVPAKQNAEALIAKAIDKNVPVETMERLLAMRRELKAEWAKEQYDKAMSAFQADCPTIEKTKGVTTKSGIVAYKYAPIESIVDQVKEYLQKHGFSYATNMELLENGTMKVKVSIRVTHEGGHSETTEMTVPLGNKTDIMSQTQVVAAAQTFAKRYAFCNAFGILTGDEDTDALREESTNQSRQQPIKTTNYLLSYKQQKNIFALLAEKGYAKKNLDAYIKTKFQKDSLSKLTMEEADIIIKKIKFLPSKAKGVATEANEVEAEQIANDAARYLS